MRVEERKFSNRQLNRSILTSVLDANKCLLKGRKGSGWDVMCATGGGTVHVQDLKDVPAKRPTGLVLTAASIELMGL